MLYLDIQRGEEEMNISEFKKNIKGTVVCMNIITSITKGCGQL